MSNKKTNNQINELYDQSKYYLILLWRDLCWLLSIIFRPLTVIAFVVTAVIIWYAQGQQGTNRLIFDIIASLGGGILGSLITERIIKLLGSSYTVKKSISAIRNLQLIKSKVSNVNDRLSQLRSKSKERDFDEIEKLVHNIQKDILNSIGDWGDVNPGANITQNFYEALDSAKSKEKKVSKELGGLKQQLYKLESSNEEEKDSLSKKIKEKEKEIDGLNSKIQDLTSFSSQIESGSLLSAPSVSPSVSLV